MNRKKYWAKLVLAGIVTVVISVAFVMLSDRRTYYFWYRCWEAAPSWRYCRSAVPFDFSTDFFGMRYNGNTANLIDRQVLMFGAYEKPILFFLRDTIEKIAPKGTGVFLDIGANNGHYSLFMSRYAREVHAFEPYEPVLEKFRRLLEINHINNVRIYPIGLGDRPAKLPFFKPPDSNDMTGSFVNEFDQENTQYKELEIAVGDEALQKSGLRKVDLIKIDVEGYEKPVLRGLNRTLNANLPIVAFELWIKPTSTLSFRSKEELATIFPNNYKFSIFNGEGDPFTGSYQLEESRIKFELEGRYEVVAYPAQKESQIPRAGPAR